MAAAAVLAGFAITPGAAYAQARAVLERNLPPPIATGGGIVIGQQDIGINADATPLGIDVAGIRLIGPRETVQATPASGISVGAIGAMPANNLSKALAGFIGQPISLQLVSRMQAAIAKAYREEGYPFVSVTLPPQEVTSGVVQLRVNEFRYGDVTAKGVSSVEGLHLRGSIRAETGSRIASALLEEDLDWLNRNPYRTVEAMFSPGDAHGSSALTLEVTKRKPWQVFGGWTNTGTEETGYQRYFAGFGAALPFIPDSFVSYQLTGSDNFWSDPAAVGTSASSPNYFSQAARFVFGTAPRQSLEISPNYVASRQNAEGELFAFTSQTFELPVIYRMAVSNLIPGFAFGDLFAGGTGKHVSRSSYFEGEEIGGASADLFELVLGWAGRFNDSSGRSVVEARLVVNPGDVLGGNTSESWRNYSAGRVDDVDYVYGTFDGSRFTRLPGGFAYVTQFSGLLSGQALPDTEQLAIGGMSATRGYVLNDASVDSGLYWRNELRFPEFPALGSLNSGKGLADEMSAYAFFDLGYGYNYGFDSVVGPISSYYTRMAGIGAGLDYRLGETMQASLVAGYPLQSAGITDAGDWTVQGRVFLVY